MAVVPGSIAVTEGVGKILDTAEVTVNSQTVEREIVSIGSPDATTPTNYATVANGGVGANVQTLVSDSINSYLDGDIQPLSLTREGRLRVAMVQSDQGQIWNNTFPINMYGLSTKDGLNPENPWEHTWSAW
jgi:hypothetical protein